MHKTYLEFSANNEIFAIGFKQCDQWDDDDVWCWVIDAIIWINLSFQFYMKCFIVSNAALLLIFQCTIYYELWTDNNWTERTKQITNFPTLFRSTFEKCMLNNLLSNNC